MLSPLRASNRDRPPLRHAPEFELIQDCDCEQRRAPTRSLNRVLLMPVYWGARATSLHLADCSGTVTNKRRTVPCDCVASSMTRPLVFTQRNSREIRWTVPAAPRGTNKRAPESDRLLQKQAPAPGYVSKLLSNPFGALLNCRGAAAVIAWRNDIPFLSREGCLPPKNMRLAIYMRIGEFVLRFVIFQFRAVISRRLLEKANGSCDRPALSAGSPEI
ncbi:hypothetical protein EVAR_100021_1 [Eumeta japonica]|uniref:Uncharacterized protein n=1 Tax=Eumeta variegata TaxID=151549 RepID=A0A4C1ZSD9_EUMVA|nr:hypothetical protein EVAR_100021_1 [Eumeta japonica]